ncbi:MAG: glycosyltransferase family 1 protein [Candidatus Moranbacteria bacterium]|jgi:glycosyltransferase involved in cell wall biosynthesis|nr:glycosyltransferase family 1 protein [Candidatus Moranbacteria bacterium]
MKIAIDIRNIGKQRTGSEVVVLELTKNILELDKENEYLLLTDTNDKSILKNIKRDLNLRDKKNARVISLKAKNKFIWAAWTMPLFFQKNKIDIFHTEYILPLFVPASVKVVTHIHDVSFKAYRQMILRKDLFFLDLLIPRSIRRSDKIIAVSQFTKDEILKYYQVEANKIEVVFNSTNLIERKFTEELKKTIRSKYNLPDEFILYIGTLQPRKNVPLLMEAYAKIKNKIPQIKLVLAGDKKAHNFDKKIEEVLERNDLSKDVFFPGFIDTIDKTIVYKMAKTYVFPSFYEGFGIPVLEAMSQGVPVLISDIPPHREVGVDEDIYFDPNSIDNLSDMLYNICVDREKREKLIELGLIKSKYFSWKESAQKMLNLFNSFNK